jgi:prephenate dehydrogenase
MNIGLLHPGEMGASIGTVLQKAGHDVLYVPEGRSNATRKRAIKAGLTEVEAALFKEWQDSSP